MILIYHQLSEDSPYLYSIGAEAFTDHLRFVQQRQGGPFCHGQPCITFDDGHASQYEALPLLEEQGVRATFFITPDWTGRKAGYMTWSQLQEVVGLGHQVESHGWSHKFLTQCRGDELETELRDSKRMLEERLGVAVEALGVPNGAFDRRVLAACAEAGYRRVFTSDPFVHRIDENGLEILGRLGVQRGMNSAMLARFAKAEGSPFSSLRLRLGAKRAVRAALGRRLYHQLWCWMAHANPAETMDGQ